MAQIDVGIADGKFGASSSQSRLRGLVVTTDFLQPQTNVKIAFGNIEASTIDERDKDLLRGLVTAKATVAEGIALLNASSNKSLDKSLVAILQANHQGIFCLFGSF